MSFNFTSEAFNEPWRNLKHPAVRQLAFSIGSPDILREIPADMPIQHAFSFHSDAQWATHLQDYWPRLRYLDVHPDSLLSFLNQLKSTRLGLRFEMLMHFWLQDRNYHPYELLGHSIQKIQGAKTLGELDFVLHNCASGQIEHWEVALKYYLGEHDLSLPHWYGLNRTDTLNRKMRHFTEKQFQFQRALDLDIQSRRCVLKGQLYLPLHAADTRLPHWINPARRMGLWGHRLPEANSGFYRLLRQEWICANAAPSSASAVWWTDGLYKQPAAEQYYMHRMPCLLAPIE